MQQYGASKAGATVIDEERQLWRAGTTECLMISCCSGAELQLRRGGAIVLRELYPTKSDLYERARALRAEAEETPGSPGDPSDSRA
jgi:hypothetical protein